MVPFRAMAEAVMGRFAPCLPTFVPVRNAIAGGAPDDEVHMLVYRRRGFRPKLAPLRTG